MCNVTKSYYCYFRIEILILKNSEVKSENDDSLPKMKFKYSKQKCNNVLIERDEVIVWHRDYIKQTCIYCSQEKNVII